MGNTSDIRWAGAAAVRVIRKASVMQTAAWSFILRNVPQNVYGDKLSMKGLDISMVWMVASVGLDEQQC